jgi:hypothetical protein
MLPEKYQISIFRNCSIDMNAGINLSNRDANDRPYFMKQHQLPWCMGIIKPMKKMTTFVKITDRK